MTPAMRALWALAHDPELGPFLRPKISVQADGLAFTPPRIRLSAVEVVYAMMDADLDATREYFLRVWLPRGVVLDDARRAKTFAFADSHPEKALPAPIQRTERTGGRSVPFARPRDMDPGFRLQAEPYRPGDSRRMAADARAYAWALVQDHTADLSALPETVRAWVIRMRSRTCALQTPPTSRRALARQRTRSKRLKRRFA